MQSSAFSLQPFFPTYSTYSTYSTYPAYSAYSTTHSAPECYTNSMAIFTAAEITEQKTAWKAALLAVSSSQSYTIGKRTLTRADLAEIRRMLEWLDEQEASVSADAAGPLFVAGRVRR